MKKIKMEGHNSIILYGLPKSKLLHNTQIVKTQTPQFPIEIKKHNCIENRHESKSNTTGNVSVFFLLYFLFQKSANHQMQYRCPFNPIDGLIVFHPVLLLFI